MLTRRFRTLPRKFVWAGRRLRQWLSPGAVVLLYHSIADVEQDPYNLRVRPSRFREHLEVLRKMSRLITLRDLVGRITNGSETDGHIVLTFDDGYADNLLNAKPLLEEYEAPATVFVTANSVNCSEEFWWDELERLILTTPVLPKRLCLAADGRERIWEVEPLEPMRSNGGLKWTLDQDDRTSRHRLFRDLTGWLNGMAVPERDSTLRQLRQWAQARSQSRATHRTMTAVELHRLAEGSLVEVGAHTVTHPHLRELSLEEQRGEIQESKLELERILEKPVSSFAYPHGSYDMRTASLVQRAGYACSCSTIADFVHSRTDVFQLPRLLVRDWDGDTFARRLRVWLAV
jgi:peptidoglycan/xylan/chitin deacetylase (PgdA/CDA1 family)